MNDINDRNYENYVDIGGKPVKRVTSVETSPTDSTKLNPSLSITEATVGTVTTKTIQKTIGTDVYQKTIAIDNSDNSIIISEWSQI